MFFMSIHTNKNYVTIFPADLRLYFLVYDGAGFMINPRRRPAPLGRIYV